MQKQIAIAEDTNEKVRSLYSASRRGAFFRFLYWAAIIGACVWSFQYMQQYLTLFPQIMNQYQKLNLGK